LPTKKFYDVFTWFVTQVGFSFIVTPFILLHTEPTFTVWRRVYFYLLFGVAAAFAFFQSPAKPFLIKQLKARSSRPDLHRVKSDASEGEVLFGVPVDAEKELQEIVAEVRQELERRKREGLELPDIRALVKEKVDSLSSKAPKLKQDSTLKTDS
jgi:lysophospholipid acyltransferase